MRRMLRKQKVRKGMNMYAVIAGMALLAVTGMVVGPRLMNAELPGYKNNIKADINSFKELTDIYSTNHDGKTEGLTLNTLVNEGILTGNMKLAVTLDATTPANSYYSPRWAEGDIRIYINGNNDITKTTANVYVDMTVGTAKVATDMYGQMETAIAEHAGKKFDPSAIDGGATTISTAAIATAVATDTNGKIMFTIQ